MRHAATCCGTQYLNSGQRRQLVAGGVVRIVVHENLRRHHRHARRLHAIDDRAEARLVELPHDAEPEEAVHLRRERLRARVHRLDDAVEMVDRGVLRCERDVESDLERHVSGERNAQRVRDRQRANRTPTRGTPGWILSRS